MKTVIFACVHNRSLCCGDAGTKGIDLSGARPQKLTNELAAEAQLLITMGCGDECPYVPGVRRDDWLVDDPKDHRR